MVSWTFSIGQARAFLPAAVGTLSHHQATTVHTAPLSVWTLAGACLGNVPSLQTWEDLTELRLQNAHMDPWVTIYAYYVRHMQLHIHSIKYLTLFLCYSMELHSYIQQKWKQTSCVFLYHIFFKILHQFIRLLFWPSIWDGSSIFIKFAVQIWNNRTSITRTNLKLHREFHSIFN